MGAPRPSRGRGRRRDSLSSACSCHYRMYWRLGAEQPVESHDSLAQPERLREPPRDALAEALHGADPRGGEVERRHPYALDPARHDPLERLEVAVDVHGE